MKPADFEYVAPDHLDAALGMLASRLSETRVLAGGQSLLPLLKARLVSPVTLIDLGCIEDLDRIELRNGALQLGAMTRQSRALESRLMRTHAPLLARALRLIGSPAIRNRGTIGGSAAHADPAAEIPAVLVALDATLTVVSTAGRREIPARTFYRYAYETSLSDDEIVADLSIPLRTAGQNTGVSFYEIAIPSHNFALAGAAVSVTVAGGVMNDVRIGLCGLGATPLRAREAETLADGSLPTPDVVRRVARGAAAVAEPVDDVLASGSYRREIAPVVIRRALLEALGEAEAHRDGAPR